MAEIRIEGAEIIIVGGSSGMGLALARRLLAEGARVTIAGRSEERLEAARRELGDPSDLKTATLDLAREEEIAAFFRDCGPVDHIVSTAADIEGAYQLLPDLQLLAAQRVVEMTIARVRRLPPRRHVFGSVTTSQWTVVDSLSIA